MGFFEHVFSGPLLLFSLPILLSMLVWLMALIGLLEFHSLDVHLHLDVGELHLEPGASPLDVDHEWVVPHWGNFFQLLGIGIVPFSLLFTLFLFLFGWIGLGAEALIGSASGLRVFGCAGMALAGALLLTGGTGRAIAPFFKDYGKPLDAASLEGHMAVLTSSTLADDFGTARVRLADGNVLQVSVRPLANGKGAGLQAGVQLVLVEYDAAKNLYRVVPFQDADTPLSGNIS